ncbi:MAG: hypothetical protein ACOC4R_00235, partial [Bacteroidota bacterium]
SVDPKADWYYSLSPYNYVANNPIILKDPNGMWIESAWDVASLGMGISSFVKNVREGNVTDAIIDGVGIVADGTALALPLIPGGAGATIKAVRATDKVIDATQTGKRVDNAAKTKTYQTYIKEAKDPSTHGDYSGRTSGTGTPEQNVAKRDSNHHMDETHGPAKLDKSSSNKDAIRGREHQNIQSKGGAQSNNGTSGNRIEAISPTNPKKQQYIDASNREFEN